MDHCPPAARCGRTLLPVLGFFAGCAALLWVTAYRYLVPALTASRNLDETGKKQLAAISVLVLAVVLVCLAIALLMVIRPSRLFMAGRHSPRSRTHYSDAWAESARRMQTPPEDQDEE